jgi:hypothetical protein
VETVNGDLPFSATVVVLGAPPELTALSSESGVPGDLVVVTGSGFEPLMEVFIDGTSIGGVGSLLVEEITATSVSFYWPIIADGQHEITIGVFPLFSNALTFEQTGQLEADEPANDLDTTTTTQITVGEAWVGAFGTGEFDDWIIVDIPADGTYDFVVDWDVDGQDLDLLLYADGGGGAGANLCVSFYSKPEADCVGQALTAGTYYVLIEDFSAATGSPANINYRFTVD